MKTVLQSTARAITQLVITRNPDPAFDVWRDIYRVTTVEAVPAGTVFRVTLNKQITKPATFADNVAWLRRFELRTPGGSIYLMHDKGNQGENVTVDGHYESDTEALVWVAPVAIPAGTVIAWMARARSYSDIAGNQYMLIDDKGCLSVEIEKFGDDDIEALSGRVDELAVSATALGSRVGALELSDPALAARMDELEARIAALEPVDGGGSYGG